MGGVETGYGAGGGVLEYGEERVVVVATALRGLLLSPTGLSWFVGGMKPFMCAGRGCCAWYWAAIGGTAYIGPEM